MSKDGTSINTFYSKCQGKGSLLLVVKDDGGNVFGAYANEEFKYTPNKFYGTGETFLFSFFKSERVYPRIRSAATSSLEIVQILQLYRKT